MDPQNPNPDPVKLEIIESSSEIMAPKPMEGLHDQAPPPFLTKTYDVVDDASTDQIVSWSQTNNSFVVWDLHAFSMILLPKYFKHNNFSSFVRQLNTYIKLRASHDRNQHGTGKICHSHRYFIYGFNNIS